MERQVDRRSFLKQMGQAGGLLMAGGLLETILVACGGNVATPDTTKKSSVPHDGLKLPGIFQWGATSENGAPYVYRDPKTTNLVGFELEIASAIAALMGVTQKQVETDYAQLDQALAAGQFDAVLNGWEITDDKKSTEIFSDPYYRNSQQIVVRTNDTRFTSKTDKDELGLKDLEGLKVGTGAGFKAEDILKSDSKIILKSYDPDLPFNDLALGRIDAVLIDYSTVTYYALGIGPGGEKNNDLKLIGKPFEPNDYVIGFSNKNKNATTLQKEINQALGILKKDGSLRKIYERWGLWNDLQGEIGVQ